MQLTLTLLGVGDMFIIDYAHTVLITENSFRNK